MRYMFNISKRTENRIGWKKGEKKEEDEELIWTSKFSFF